MTDDPALVAVKALLRVIAHNMPEVRLDHPEDHGLTKEEAEAVAWVLFRDRLAKVPTDTA